MSDAKYASYVKQGKGKTTFDTLLLPSSASADGAVQLNRLAVGTLTPDLATALDIRYGDGGRGTYYKSWASKATRSFGSYSFDGKMLYAEDRSLVLYDGSKVTLAGEVLLTSPVAVNDVAVSYAGSTLRIDGRGLTASTDPAKAIGIAAPNTTEVLLNGVRVTFSRTGDLVYAAAALS